MPIFEGTLVVRADGTMRIAKRVKLRADEIGFHVRVIIPDSWGRTHGEIIAEVPDSLVQPSVKSGVAKIGVENDN